MWITSMCARAPLFGEVALPLSKAADSSVVLDHAVQSRCTSGFTDMTGSRLLAWLERGAYTVQLTNLQAQPGLGGVSTTVALYFWNGK